MSEFKRLTTRSPRNNMPYLVNVKDDEQEVNGSYNTLKCIQDSWERLAQYEETGLSPLEVAELITVKNELLEALKKIFDPISYMKKEADEKGYMLDVGIAISLASSPYHLKNIAEKAIAKATQTTPQPRENRF